MTAGELLAALAEFEGGGAEVMVQLPGGDFVFIEKVEGGSVWLQGEAGGQGGQLREKQYVAGRPSFGRIDGVLLRLKARL